MSRLTIVGRPALTLLALVVIVLAPPNARAQGTGTLVGRVVEARTEAPVEGAAVRVLGTMRVAFTAADGTFGLRGVPTGARRVRIERLGYAARVLNVEVAADGRTALQVSLELRPVAIGAIVAAATKREQASSDAPVSVSVIDRQEVERRAPATAADAIAYVPSAQFVGDQLNIRGSSGYSRGSGTRVLLLLDGVPANSGDNGALFWDMIPVTEIERIEVVKGAGSALYGTSALGGVVNVVTRAPPEEPLTKIRLRGGFYDDPPARPWVWADRTLGFGSLEVSHGRRIGPLATWVRAGRAEDDGYRQNGDADRTNLAARFRLGAGDADSLRFFGTWARQNSGSAFLWCVRGECRDPHQLAFQPLKVPRADRDDRTRNDKTHLHVTHERAWSPALETIERISYQRNDWRTRFGDGSSIGAIADRFGGELRAVWGPWNPIAFTLGVEGAYTHVSADLFGRHDVTDLSAFGQLEAAVTSWLALTAGARSDLRLIDGGSLTDPWSSQFSPRVGLVVKPDPVTRVRASVGRGFRAPSVAELFTATEVGGFQVVPNDSLKPERSIAGELGVQRLLTEWLWVDAAAFYYDFENLIEADTISGPGGAIQATFQNLPKATVRGLELVARTSFLRDALSTRLAYTYLDTEDEQADAPLPYRPDHLLTAALTVRLGAVELGADYRYASAFDRVQVFTDPRIDQLVPMRVLDLRVAYRLGRQTIRFLVDNTTNHAYTTIERNLEPIRSYTVSLDLEF